MKIPVAIVAWLLLLSGWAAAGNWERGEVEQLAPGRLLVAMPHLRDPNFIETVVLVIDHGQRGTMGLVLNRPTALALGDALNQRGLPLDEKLFFGGPVQASRHLVLVQSAQPPEGGLEVLPGLHLVHGAAAVAQLLEAAELPSRFRVFSGYAGWGPMQLEHEIYRGDWLVLPVPMELILETRPEALWPQLIRYSHDQMAARAGLSPAG